jgi:hypothetical protein
MTVVDMLRELRQAVAALEQNLADERPRRRLRRSVIRPLDQALAQLTGQAGAAAIDPDPAPPSDAAAGLSAADSVLEVARRATRLRVEHDDGLPLEVLEAVAGLQDVAVILAPDQASARRATFAELQASATRLPACAGTTRAPRRPSSGADRPWGYLRRHR